MSLHQNIKIKNNGTSFFDYKKPKKLTASTIKSFMGFGIYLVVFIVIIPCYLFKFKYFTLLEAYLPNVDLIANIVSYRGGPFGDNMFVDLYSSTITSFNSYLQSTFINYFALLGVTYIIARETHVTKSISKGWSIGFAMLIITYLLPSHFITELMNRVYSKIGTKNTTISYAVSIIVGTIATVAIILFEKQFISYSRNSLSKLAKNIIAIPKKL